MISIIICSVNPVLYARICAQYTQLMGAEPFETIGIHDARGISEGYNRGLAQSKGDIVLFSHDDIEIWQPDFTARLKRHLQRFDVIGVAGTNKLVGPGWHSSAPPYTLGQVTHPIAGQFQLSFFGAYRQVMGDMQAMDGVLLAFRRPAIEQIRWDDQTFTGFHLYDMDATYRAFRAGYKLAVAADLPILHMSGGSYDQNWQHFAGLFMRKHGATLETHSPRSCQVSIVQLSSREEAQELMHLFYRRLPE